MLAGAERTAQRSGAERTARNAKENKKKTQLAPMQQQDDSEAVGKYKTAHKAEQRNWCVWTSLQVLVGCWLWW